MVGGGTDLAEFYKQHGGAVVSFAIDKYIYIMLNKHFGGGFRVSYSETENVDNVEDIKHDIVREALKAYDVSDVEIISCADVPGVGTGLGSSSSFAVGLTLAIWTHMRQSANLHPGVFAEKAYYLEHVLCGHPVGKQDHYAAAYGGFNYFQFNRDNTVSTQPVRLGERNYEMFHHNMMLFRVGKTRQADTILTQQALRLRDDPLVIENAIAMKNLAVGLNEDLQKDYISSIGTYIGMNWQLKRDLAIGISPKEISILYDKAMEAGASGGKLCGAGGSGYLLFYAPNKYHNAIEKAVGLERTPFNISNEGAKVIYKDFE